MDNPKPTILVTGISGNLGRRLLPLLAGYHIIGVDLNPPSTSDPVQFVRMDLGEEESCRDLMLLLRDSRAVAVVHLAFVSEPAPSSTLDPDRIWRTNVAGSARVLEAIGETNRYEPIVQKVIVPSSAMVYGPDLSEAATEDSLLAAHTLPYAEHKMEVEKVLQQRAPGLRGCSVYSLRSHTFGGRAIHNFVISAFRGERNGTPGKGKKAPYLLPLGDRYLNHRIQFIHVDDVARLVTYIIQRSDPETQRLTVLNVAGRGEPLTLARCFELARTPVRRLPGKAAFDLALRLYWKLGISALPPQAGPYITGEFTVNTERLREFLGDDYEKVIRYTCEEAFEDCLTTEPVHEA
jgi:nucleoside-diphosphate-sugar epimerase